MYNIEIIAGKLSITFSANKAKAGKVNPINVDFCSSKFARRITEHNLYKEPLIKCLGKQNKNKLTIIDATAGFGSDAFIMAAFGAKVILIEQNPTIFSLLEDGVKRAQQSEDVTISAIAKNMLLFCGNAVVLLPQLVAQYAPDIIYLDPMFEDTGNTALPKKHMLLLRALDAKLSDSDQLFNTAAATNCKKIVVKRHKLSPYLLNKKPHHSFVGKANRFDIYLCSTMPV